jgi:hypothetical protein
MLRRGRRAAVARYIVEYWPEFVEYIISLCKLATFLKWNPCP